MRAFLADVATRAGAKLRTVRNRGFRTGLRHDPEASAVLLSPHPDDAVLDCWSVLTGPAAIRVVNAFAGIPAQGPAEYYERLAGARDAGAHMRRRVAQDRAALACAGRSAVNLRFLDLAHRHGRPEPSFAALDAVLCDEVPDASCVYVPAALGAAHPDHDLVRCYGHAIARQGMPVRQYADVPYCTVYGWPAWVTGDEPDLNLDVDAFWRASPGGPTCPRGAADVVRLSPPQAAAKLAAMRAYEAEFAVLDRGPVRQVSNPAIHGFEVFWPVPAGRC
jgi:LmbE family N-acetylglucosaminyl deacetylase